MTSSGVSSIRAGSTANGGSSVLNGKTTTRIHFLISKFLPVLNVICSILGNSPASEFYMPTFRNILLHLHRQVGMKKTYKDSFTIIFPVSTQNLCLFYSYVTLTYIYIYIYIYI